MNPISPVQNVHQQKKSDWNPHLVGGLEHVLFSHILGIIIPIDIPFFERGRYTTNQNMTPEARAKPPNEQYGGMIRLTDTWPDVVRLGMELI